jgi:ribosomal protein S26
MQDLHWSIFVAIETWMSQQEVSVMRLKDLEETGIKLAFQTQKWIEQAFLKFCVQVTAHLSHIRI